MVSERLLTRSKIGLLSAAVVSLGYDQMRARNDGIPPTQTLTYAGTLEESNVPVNGVRNLRLTLWDDATNRQRGRKPAGPRDGRPGHGVHHRSSGITRAWRNDRRCHWRRGNTREPCARLAPWHHHGSARNLVREHRVRCCQLISKSRSPDQRRWPAHPPRQHRDGLHHPLLTRFPSAIHPRGSR